MNKRIIFLLVLVALMCALALSVSAADKIVVHDNDSLSNEVSVLDSLENSECADTVSRVVLSDLQGGYYVFPAYYVISGSNYNLSMTKLNEAITAYNEANGTSYFTGFDHTGGTGSFRGKCLNLVRVELPTYVTTFNGNHKFEACANLKEVIFPYYYSEEEGRNVGYVTSNGTGAQNWFTSCKALERVVNFGNLPLTTLQNDCFSGCSALKAIELPYKLETIVGGGFANCTGLESVTIPSTLKSIGKRCFQSCKLTNVDMVLPEGLTAIGYEAFYKTSINSIVIPSTVTSISDRAFIESNIKYVTVKCPTIGTNMFNACKSLEKVVFDGVTVILNRAFKDCKALKNIVLPNGVTQIDDYAFYGCSSVDKISVPSTVVTMGVNVFENTSCTEAIIKSSAVGKGMFTSSTVKSVVIESANAINAEAFRNCKELLSISLPSTLTAIGDNVFYGCRKLSELTISASVTSISTNAFSYCSGLKTINYTGNNEDIIKAAVTGSPEVTGVTYVKVNHCVVYNGGNHTLVGENVLEGSFLSQIAVKNGCSACGEEELIIETIGALFTYHGYSCTEKAINGTHSVAQFFGVNNENVAKYEELTGKTVNFGIVATGNADGTAIKPLEKGDKVITQQFSDYPFEEDTEKNYFAVKVNGIASSYVETNFIFCTYVSVDGEVVYLDNNAQVTELAGISHSQLNSILN